jgi:hypothetical protein
MIVTSTLTTDNPQKDGRFRVWETHVDQTGLKYIISYLAAIGTNTASNMAARAIQIANDLVANEIMTNLAAVSTLGAQAQVSLKYSTFAQSGAALRAFYLVATQEQAIMTGEYLASLTNAQLQSLFGITAGQVTTIRTNKLTPAVAAAATIRAAVGA